MESQNQNQDQANHQIKRVVGRPKADRTICKKCEQQKELITGRIICRECWNDYFKNYYSTKTEYANKKRTYQRNYHSAKISSAVVGGNGDI
jgi:hypothetical protein